MPEEEFARLLPDAVGSLTKEFFAVLELVAPLLAIGTNLVVDHVMPTDNIRPVPSLLFDGVIVKLYSVSGV